MPAMSGAEPCTASKMDASLGGLAHGDLSSIKDPYPSDVARWGETETTNQARAHIRQNITIKVGHHHNAVRIRLGILYDLFEGSSGCHLSGMRQNNIPAGRLDPTDPHRRRCPGNPSTHGGKPTRTYHPTFSCPN